MNSIKLQGVHFHIIYIKFSGNQGVKQDLGYDEGDLALVSEIAMYTVYIFGSCRLTMSLVQLKWDLEVGCTKIAPNL